MRHAIFTYRALVLMHIGFGKKAEATSLLREASEWQEKEIVVRVCAGTALNDLVTVPMSSMSRGISTKATRAKFNLQGKHNS